MYINDLGMRDAGSHIAAADAANLNTEKGNTEKTRKSETGRFPTTLEKTVESLVAGSGQDAQETVDIREALERLKSDPEWKDVGTALEALYTNQQKMQIQQIQTSMLSSGYYSGLTGLGMSGSPLAFSALGSNAALLSAYGGTAGLLGSSIFKDVQL